MSKKVKQLSAKNVKDTNDSDDEETPLQKELRFQEELKWCIDELENMTLSSVSSKSGTSKDCHEKALKVLKNNKCSFIKKRQLMSNLFGDYRAKMREQQLKRQTHNKNEVNLKQVPKSDCQTPGQCVYLRKKIPKSDCQTPGQCVYLRKKINYKSNVTDDHSSEFKFNFQ